MRETLCSAPDAMLSCRPRRAGGPQHQQPPEETRRMAKSARSGENRGRRPADKRRPEEQQAKVPDVSPASADDRGLSATAVLGEGKRITADDIRRRAYELFTARGGTHGYDIEDWLKAERELRGK